MWQPVLERVSREREVVALDLPGFGDSEEHRARPTVEALADAAAEFLDGIGLAGAHVAGNSLGGGVALAMARAGDGALGLRALPAGFVNDREGDLRARRADRVAPRGAALAPRAELVCGGPVRAHARVLPPRRAAVADPGRRGRGRDAQPRPADRRASRRPSRRSRTSAGPAGAELPGHRRLGREGPACSIYSRQSPRARRPRCRARATSRSPAAATSRPGTTRSRSRGCCWRRRAGRLGVRRGGPDGRRRHEGRDDDHREGEDLDDDAEHVGGHRIAEDDDAAEDAGDVGGGRGRGDDRDGLAVLQAAGRGVEGDDRAEDGDQQPGREDDAEEAVARPVSALMATSETPNRTPAAPPSMTPWWWSGAPKRGPVISSAPIASIAASKAIMPASE